MSNIQDEIAAPATTSPSPETWVPAGHYYSPIVDPDDANVARILDNFDNLSLAPNAGIVLNEEEMLATLKRISSYYSEMPFQDDKSPGLRYYFRNGLFEQGDGTVYFGMLRDVKPKRVIEVGVGYSSCLLMDTNEKFFNGQIETTFIDPYPDTLQSLTADGSFRGQLIQSKLQDVPLSLFEKLATGDILFIDSTHVSKMGSDVNHYMFRILPSLPPGVLIHIHDIFYPFEYSSEWIRKENRSWNEAYLLRAFLQFNSAFSVMYFNHYVYRAHKDVLSKAMPKCLENPGGSIWIRRIR